MDTFRKELEEARYKFNEKIKASFILNSRYSTFKEPSKEDISWLMFSFPNSTIKVGYDQGATYWTINPNF